MATAVIGALRAELSAGVAKFAEDMGKAGKQVSKFSRKFRETGAAISGAGRSLSLYVTGPVAAMGTLAVRSFQTQENAIAAVDAALESMGNAAGYTSKELQAMASEMQNASTFGDEDILNKVTANLLTFGNVQGEVFRRAQQSALDLSARLGQDLQSSAVMLGKALNDPAYGLTALTRVGVAFTEEQKEMIKAMSEAGDVAGAQSIMLAELEKQYGGQAAAMAATSQGSMQQLNNAWGDFMEVVGKVIADALPPLVQMMRRVVEWLQQLDPKTVAWGVAIAGVAAVIGPLVLVVGTLVSGFGGLLSVMGLIMKAGPAFALMAKGIGLAIATMGGPITLAITAVAALAGAFLMYRDEIIGYASQLIEHLDQAMGGRLVEIVEGAKAGLQFFADQFAEVFKMLGQIMTGDFAGALETFGGLWQNIFGGLVTVLNGAAETIGGVLIILFDKLDQAFGGRLTGIFDGAKAVIGFFVEQVKLVFTMLGQIMTGDFAGAMETFSQLWANVWSGVENIVSTTVTAIGDWLKNKFGKIVDWVGDKLETMKDGFKSLYDAVVGGSYIPDMVDGIIAEMGRLNDGFVKPAEQMTDAVGGAFEGLGSQISGIFDELVRTGTVSTDSLLRLGTSILQQFAGASGGGGSGGGGGWLGAAASIFGSAFGGGLANGGLAMAGRPYIVGERGPELFRPHMTGTVDPDVSSGGGVTQVFNISTPNADSFRRSERQIMRGARQKLRVG